MSFFSTSFRVLLLASFIVIGLNASSTSSWYETYKLSKSVATFHLSILYNKIRYGRAFNFDPVMSGSCADQKDPKLCVCIQEGKIASMHDGKKSPLLLGSIPRYKEHIDEIRKHANICPNDKIGMYTLNRDFERNWSGLAQLEKTESIISHRYPTIDDCAPSFVDLIRAVRDLENRDEKGVMVAYIHCKAGRGRSAATADAYCMHVCNKCGVDATPQQIEEYLKSQRNRISMTYEQRQMLNRFYKELKAAGSFNALFAKYKSEVEKRDQEFITPGNRQQ